MCFHLCQRIYKCRAILVVNPKSVVPDVFCFLVFSFFFVMPDVNLG